MNAITNAAITNAAITNAAITNALDAIRLAGNRTFFQIDSTRRIGSPSHINAALMGASHRTVLDIQCSTVRGLYAVDAVGCSTTEIQSAVRNFDCSAICIGNLGVIHIQSSISTLNVWNP